MADGWLEAAEYHPAPSGGGTQYRTVDKLVLHTTEGGTIEGAIGAYKASNSWPHFTVDPLQRRMCQHIAMDRSAMALYNGPQPMETNRGGVVQVEIVGFARNTHTYSDSWYQWLAEHVVRPICERMAIPRRCTKFYGEGDGYVLATPSWIGRMQDAEFNAYKGICGHQNVGDGNDHWDPGKLNEAKLLAYAFGGGEVYDPVTNGSWKVGTGGIDFEPQLQPQPDEDEELMGKADDILAWQVQINNEVAAIRAFLGAAFGGGIECYPTATGQWRTAALVEGKPTHGGVVMTQIAALIYEAASATRIAPPAMTSGGTPAPVDVEAVADAVIAKLRRSFATG